MAMNFYESQDVARKKTGLLVLLFALAVAGIIVVLHIVVWVTMGFAQGQVDAGGDKGDMVGLLDPVLLGFVAVGTIVVIGGGSLYKLMELRSGGRVVAEGLGGKLVSQNTSDSDERKLLNVVQEMAIASGTPTPPVYIMDGERGINAFAAGYSPNDAVIGVTRGCIETLSRDELQGVIAHEFSHIMNGDMRLNIRLIGVLNGILVLGIVGYYIFRVSLYSGGGRRRGSDKGSGGQIIFLGLGLMAVGFIGTFFGNMIKAAVSRQREFLADASAVQFTRNPDGIGNALMKIGGFSQGSRLENAKAAEISHMLFSRGITTGLQSMFATHPPLGNRIKRILPSWDGKFIKGKKAKGRDVGRSAKRAGISGFGGAGVAGLAGASVLGNAIDQVGLPTKDHIRYARELVGKMPEEVKAAANEPYGSRAVVYAMLINPYGKARQIQLRALEKGADRGVYDETVKLLPFVEKMRDNARLPLIDMAMPALRSLAVEQYRTFMKNVEQLIVADERIDLFEWSLQKILVSHLAPQYERVSPSRVRYRSLKRLQAQCCVLLSGLAHAGNDDDGKAREAFERGVAEIDMGHLKLLPARQCRLNILDDAINSLAGLTGQLKKRVLHSAGVCISADEEITINEAELFRAISDSLGCPMPPLLPGQPLV